jgi:hypothetical protein
MAERRSGGQTSERAAHWRAIIAAWSESGLTQPAFCSQKGIPLGTFAWWKHELSGGSQKRTRRPRRSRFLRVELRPSAHPAGDSNQDSIGSAWAVAPPATLAVPLIELLLPDGVRVRLYADCDTELLGRVLTTLRDGRC